jgi:hypothetical protein
MAGGLKNNQSLSTDDLKRRWREYVTACDLVRAENAAALLRWERNARGLRPTPAALPILPDDLRGLRCGARNRRGTPCRMSEIYRNGRCKFHGGLSTGPKTGDGKARARSNLGKRWSSELHADCGPLAKVATK